MGSCYKIEFDRDEDGSEVAALFNDGEHHEHASNPCSVSLYGRTSDSLNKSTKYYVVDRILHDDLYPRFFLEAIALGHH